MTTFLLDEMKFTYVVFCIRRLFMVWSRILDPYPFSCISETKIYCTSNLRLFSALKIYEKTRKKYFILSAKKQNLVHIDLFLTVGTKEFRRPKPIFSRPGILHMLWHVFFSWKDEKVFPTSIKVIQGAPFS